VVSSFIVLIEQGADNARKGDADGLGGTRKRELMKSSILLGLRKEEDVFVVESQYAYFFPLKIRCRHCLLTLVPPGNSQIA
jgi:hypothetical protein